VYIASPLPATGWDALPERTRLQLAAAGLLALTLAGAAGWWHAVTLARPLRRLVTAAGAVAAGDLTQRVPEDGSIADLRSLGHAFNGMTAGLRRADQAKSAFVADVTHELRTPLTVIKGNADLIRKIGADEESLDSIKDEADRLTRLVGDLLLLAQAESGKLPLNLNPVELDMLLTDVFQQMRVLAGEKVKLRLTEIDQAMIQGDRDRLKQVFINLVSNAIHYTPTGGDVFLSLSKSEEMARVVVRDTGPGIPAKDLPHIFDRFYRGEKSRTRSKTGGFGLGLSIAYWIVDHHGGRIEVDSREGQGTTFVVFLPLIHGSPSL